MTATWSMRWYGKRVIAQTTDLMGEKLKLLAILTHRRMITSFTPRPPGSGPGRGHVPSKPGQPPAVDTGNLRSAVLWELDTGESSKSPGLGRRAKIARIGVPKHAIYGLWLEEGTKRVAARPWMKPALKYVLSQVGSVFR